jgi:hypothetical protein
MGPLKVSPLHVDVHSAAPRYSPAFPQVLVSLSTGFHTRNSTLFCVAEPADGIGVA